MPGIGLAPGGAMAMKDVCDLNPGAAHGRRLGAGCRPFFGQRREPVERAGYSTDRPIGDAGVKGRGVELGMAEQHLDDADVCVLLEQMCGKAVGAAYAATLAS